MIGHGLSSVCDTHLFNFGIYAFNIRRVEDHIDQLIHHFKFFQNIRCKADTANSCTKELYQHGYVYHWEMGKAEVSVRSVSFNKEEVRSKHVQLKPPRENIHLAKEFRLLFSAGVSESMPYVWTMPSKMIDDQNADDASGSDLPTIWLCAKRAKYEFVV